MVQEWVSDFFTNQEQHKGYIRRQFETRFVMGRMKGRIVAEPTPIDVFVPMHRESAMPRTAAPALNVPDPTPVRDQTPMEEVVFEPPNGPENEDEIINNFPELFDCFSTKGRQKRMEQI